MSVSFYLLPRLGINQLEKKSSSFEVHLVSSHIPDVLLVGAPGPLHQVVGEFVSEERTAKALE